jgi:hypothetical protein
MRPSDREAARFGHPGAKRPTRLDIYPSAELRKALDRWRLEQPDTPSRAEAGRQLLEKALRAEGFEPGVKP